MYRRRALSTVVFMIALSCALVGSPALGEGSPAVAETSDLAATDSPWMETESSAGGPSALCIPLFADGFDSGDLSTWDSNHTAGNGILEATAQAAESGSYGMSCTVNGSGDLAFVRDTSPMAETGYRASFALQVHQATMDNGAAHTLFRARDLSLLRNVLLINFARIDGHFYIKAQVRLDDDSWAATPWVNVSPAGGRRAFDDVEIEVLASTGVPSNGELRFTVNQTSHVLTGLANANLSIDRISLGQFGGIEANTKAQLFFDTFSSCRF